MYATIHAQYTGSTRDRRKREIFGVDEQNIAHFVYSFAIESIIDLIVYIVQFYPDRDQSKYISEDTV
jgi:hypothetical protein